MDSIIRIFPTPNRLAEEFALELIEMINESARKKEKFTVALSGGSTPEILFSVLAETYSKSVQWENVHFFWGDERCVPPDNPESNYGFTWREFLSKINIPSSNIHRIKGEDDPEKETWRYSNEVTLYTRNRDGIPLFDVVLLGIGEDGHTASIFPGNQELFYSDKICDVVFHPGTLQKRITLTGRVINNADEVIFIVTGKRKQAVIENILKKNPSALNYPAYYVVPLYGRLKWLLDWEAGDK
jgi:6-phosphogluconolactonase